jgi:alpha-tubulin suppressor-like RCC1 family protein
MAIKADGTLWAWGRNQYGQLGIGSTDANAHPTPIQIGADTDWALVSAGVNHTVAIKTNGTLWAWGDNDYGQIGDNKSSLIVNAPKQIGASTDWISASAGNSFTVAISSVGNALWAWGDNLHGQLGDNTTTQRYVPTPITGILWKTATAGGQHTVGIKTDDTMSAMGQNAFGQLGDGTTTARHEAVNVGAIYAAAVAAGSFHTLAVATDGRLFAWGQNTFGQLGDGTTTNSNTLKLLGTGYKVP